AKDIQDTTAADESNQVNIPGNDCQFLGEREIFWQSSFDTGALLFRRMSVERTVAVFRVMKKFVIDRLVAEIFKIFEKL
ncbi:MAG: hypothetical protein KKF80_04210, partial [Candidatus Omnitrophica bacterium]|nr:hypothetical protein [Candidatus Omnitrophota bacterium]